MTLQILGNDWSGESLWFATERGETDTTPAELAHARQRVTKYGHAYLGHLAVDESDVDKLIEAMNEPQFLYPYEVCSECDRGATQRIEGDFFCHGHAAAFGAREQDAVDAAMGKS